MSGRKSSPISRRLSLNRLGVSKARSLPQTCSFIVLKPERAAVCGFLPSLNPLLMSSELREKTPNPPLNPAAASETKHKRMSLVLSTDAFWVFFFIPPHFHKCANKDGRNRYSTEIANVPINVGAQAGEDCSAGIER